MFWSNTGLLGLLGLSEQVWECAGTPEDWGGGGNDLCAQYNLLLGSDSDSKWETLPRFTEYRGGRTCPGNPGVHWNQAQNKAISCNNSDTHNTWETPCLAQLMVVQNGPVPTCSLPACEQTA